MATKRRKPGDWKAVAAGRMKTQREMLRGHGLSNIPQVGEVGSAAYRRLLARQRGSQVASHG